MRSKLSSLQVLRAFAVLAVVACHALVFPVGAAGVDLFFVLSGYIIGGAMVGRSPVNFVVDRAWRIYPIYWLMLAPWLIAAWSKNVLPLDSAVASVTLWPILAEGYTRPILLPAWTLCYELLFYVAAAVQLAIGRSWVVVSAYGLCFAIGMVTEHALFDYIGNPLILEFLFGLALLRVSVKPSAGIALIVLSLAVFTVSPARALFELPVSTSGPEALARAMWWGLPSAAIVAGALALEPHAKHLPSLVKVGDASYSIYLVHATVLLMLPGPGLPAAILAVLVGMLTYRYIERPLMGFRKRLHAAEPSHERPQAH